MASYATNVRNFRDGLTETVCVCNGIGIKYVYNTYIRIVKYIHHCRPSYRSHGAAAHVQVFRRPKICVLYCIQYTGRAHSTATAAVRCVFVKCIAGYETRHNS